MADEGHDHVDNQEQIKCAKSWSLTTCNLLVCIEI